jgi:deoxyribonuclease V
MVAQQRAVADAAVFDDTLGFGPDAVSIRTPVGTDDPGQRAVGPDTGPTLVGIDQGFRDRGERTVAVGAAVAVGGGRVIDRARATVPVGMPYVPGLLSYREAPAVLSVLDALDATPDLLVIDGSGRIHFRQAGLATHVGVVRGVPAVGVAKSLLCGTPRRSLPDDGLPAGARVGIAADGDVTAPDGTVIGYALQSKQFDGDRHVNPLFVSPGHRVTAATAADLVARTSAGYKLPEPTRLADRHAASAPDRDA